MYSKHTSATLNSAVATPTISENTPPPLSPEMVYQIAYCAAEVVHGIRRLSSIQTHLSLTAGAQLELQAQAASSSPPVHISMLGKTPQANIYKTSDNCYDCVVILLRNGRPFAVALRFVYRHQRWIASELSVL